MKETIHLTDTLATLFQMQKELNKRCGVDPESWQELTEYEHSKLKQEWIKQFTLALTQEAGELIDCTCWKWWAKYQHFDEQNAKVEIVDMLHFLISLAQVMGMSADDVFQAYLKKHAVNNQRQDAGYDKKDENDSRHI